ncbi:thymidine kinase [Aphelenchoides avenae]|nr:thymidine kinase [Aphelenchus avenae]
MPALTTRYSKIRQKAAAISALTLREVIDCLRDHEVVAIDEGQFFSDIVEFSEELANSGKTVIISALNGDFQRKPFPVIAKLFAMAEKIDKVTAVCHACGQSASFTWRTVQSNEREVIGGAEKYQAVCRSCYFELGNIE